MGLISRVSSRTYRESEMGAEAAKIEKRGRGRPKGSVKGAGKAKTVKKTGETIGKSRGRPKLSLEEKARRADEKEAKRLEKQQLREQKAAEKKAEKLEQQQIREQERPETPSSRRYNQIKSLMR